LVVSEKAMEWAREIYAGTEQLPQAETSGIRTQTLGSALPVARTSGAAAWNCPNRLWPVSGVPDEFELQGELPRGVGFLEKVSAATLLEVATETA
jgi:hypothetical protein